MYFFLNSTSEVAQQVKVLATKPDDLSSTPGAHMVGEPSKYVINNLERLSLLQNTSTIKENNKCFFKFVCVNTM